MDVERIEKIGIDPIVMILGPVSVVVHHTVKWCVACLCAYTYTSSFLDVYQQTVSPT